MGQARARGNYEQRKAASKGRDVEIPVASPSVMALYWPKKRINRGDKIETVIERHKDGEVMRSRDGRTAYVMARTGIRRTGSC